MLLMPDSVVNISRYVNYINWSLDFQLRQLNFQFLPCHFRLAEAEGELAAVMSVLAEKQKKLADVEAQIAELQASYEHSVNEKETLSKNMAQTAARLKRAGKLTTALGDEQGRWEETVKVQE